MAANGFSNCKSLVVLGIVVACFAILTPKMFFPADFFHASEGTSDDYDDYKMKIKDLRMREAVFLRRSSENRQVLGTFRHGVDSRAQVKEGKLGTLGYVMPLYTMAIVLFFLYSMHLAIKCQNKSYNEDAIDGDTSGFIPTELTRSTIKRTNAEKLARNYLRNKIMIANNGKLPENINKIDSSVAIGFMLRDLQFLYQSLETLKRRQEARSAEIHRVNQFDEQMPTDETIVDDSEQGEEMEETSDDIDQNIETSLEAEKFTYTIEKEEIIAEE